MTYEFMISAKNSFAVVNFNRIQNALGVCRIFAREENPGSQNKKQVNSAASKAPKRH